MGQYWRFVNIDKSQRSYHLGKYGEFFFGRSPGWLLHLLAVPVAPIVAPNASGDRLLAGSWAGDRIICLGDYAESWPTGCVTTEDLARFQAEAQAQEEHNEVINSADVVGMFKQVKKVEYGPGREASYPSDRIWVLRNLTKKVFVRANGLPTYSRQHRSLQYQGDGGLNGFPGLACVLPSRIGWSDVGSSSMCCDCDVASGRWAGDRFEVRVFDDDLKEAMANEGWKDVSRREAVRLHEIWDEDGTGDCGPLPDEPQPA